MLLVFPLVRWASAPSGTRIGLPQTPLDRSTPWSAALWRFLVHAREFVPKGATFTVFAPDLRAEMELFMMSIGLLPDRVPVPASYFGNPLPERGAQAKYVLVFRCGPAPGGGTLVARVPDGCVFRRDAAP